MARGTGACASTLATRCRARRAAPCRGPSTCRAGRATPRPDAPATPAGVRRGATRTCTATGVSILTSGRVRGEAGAGRHSSSSRRRALRRGPLAAPRRRPGVAGALTPSTPRTAGRGGPATPSRPGGGRRETSGSRGRARGRSSLAPARGGAVAWRPRGARGVRRTPTATAPGAARSPLSACGACGGPGCNGRVGDEAKDCPAVGGTGKKGGGAARVRRV